MRGSERDRHAFEAEVLPHLDAAYRLARALTENRPNAEDLVQEAFLRAFAGFGGYQRGTNARAWLLTIVRRVYLNDRRRARSRPFLAPLTEEDEPAAMSDLTTPGPEEQALRSEEQRLVFGALAELPEAWREVLALVDLEGLHYAEAALVLECPIGTVMSRLHRGRAELARRLRPAMEAEARR